MNKRVCYLGNFRPFWSSENYIKTGFENIRWSVDEVQEDTFEVNDVIEGCEGCDLLLWTKTWQDRQPGVQEVINNTDIPSAAVHLDLYAGIERNGGIYSDAFWRAPDFIFTADGGHQDLFNSLNINHYHLSPGVDKEGCYLSEPDDKYRGIDICFLGSYSYHKEWKYRVALINWLDDTYGDRFRLIGHDSKTWGHDKNKLFASAKIVMGDSLYSPQYWSDRIPEVTGRGGFLIHPRVPGLEKEYEYYKHFIPYDLGDFEGLKEIIDYYLEHDDERNKIREQACEYVKGRHTWDHKVREMLEVMELD